ncbi:TetR-like C-terminal domain-containing protein, partial [Calidithermus terrae]|uniref:TetR-like C-terminal domain-containing protein n=1 Tax=Calidithermus terrae TaxID=1408545 RepID=UPI001C3FA3D4
GPCGAFVGSALRASHSSRITRCSRGSPARVAPKRVRHLQINPSHPLVRRIFAVGVENILRVSPPRPGAAVPADLAAQHLMASVLRLLKWWLEQGMPYPPARMGEILSALVIEPARRLAFAP